MGAGVIFQDRTGKVLLLKPSYKEYWTIPGGAVENDESPLEACIREAKEEIGINVTIKGLILVDYLHSNGDVDENLQWIFNGGILGKRLASNIKVDGKEILDYKFMAIEDAVKMLGSKLARRLSNYKKAFDSGQIAYMEDGLEIF